MSVPHRVYTPVTLSTLFTEVDGILYADTLKLSDYLKLTHSFIKKIVKQYKIELEELGEVKIIEKVRTNRSGLEVRSVTFILSEAQVLYVAIYIFVPSTELRVLRKSILKNLWLSKP